MSHSGTFTRQMWSICSGIILAGEIVTHWEGKKTHILQQTHSKTKPLVGYNGYK